MVVEVVVVVEEEELLQHVDDCCCMDITHISHTVNTSRKQNSWRSVCNCTPRKPPHR